MASSCPGHGWNETTAAENMLMRHSVKETAAGSKGMYWRGVWFELLVIRCIRTVISVREMEIVRRGWWVRVADQRRLWLERRDAVVGRTWLLRELMML